MNFEAATHRHRICHRVSDIRIFFIPEWRNELSRPEFIPSDVFRQYLKASQLNKHVRIDRIMATSYVVRCEREGNPLPHKMRNGSKCWRLIDIVARARAYCLSVQPSFEEEITRDIDSLLAEKEALSIEIHTKRHDLAIKNASVHLTGATLLTESEIASARLDLPICSGVYFLLSGERVVYVGQSTKIFSRVLDHMKSKDFDGFAYVPCNVNALDVLESLYIHTLRPELNAEWNKGKGVNAPLRLDTLLAQQKY